MEKLLNGLLEEAKKNKDILIHLKNLSVRAGQFELAAQLRDLENEFFPESKEAKEAREIRNALSMVDLGIPEDICWLISKTLKAHQKKKGKFSIEDAAHLMAERERLFTKSE